ncbi:unnamed protein product [Musa textilis]
MVSSSSSSSSSDSSHSSASSDSDSSSSSSRRRDRRRRHHRRSGDRGDLKVRKDHRSRGKRRRKSRHGSPSHSASSYSGDYSSDESYFDSEGPRKKHKHEKSKKFLGRDKEDGVRRSAISGKKILLKLDKSKEDKMAENNRNELLKFLNASYD